MKKQFYALTDGVKIYEVKLMNVAELRIAQAQTNKVTKGTRWWEVAKVTIGD